MRNKESWERYKEASNNKAMKIKEDANNGLLSIEEVRAHILVLNWNAKIERFRITWERSGGKPSRKKKKSAKDCKELSKEQYEEVEEMVRIGFNYKDINTRLYKMKNLMYGPKVRQAEPACINDPNTDKLITDT